MDFKFELSWQESLSALGLGLLVFAAFRLLSQRLSNWPGSRPVRRILPALEGVVWLLYLGWFIHQFSGGELDYLVSLSFLLLVIGFVAWFALKDFIAGIIIKFDGLYTAGDRVSIGGVRGVITAMGYRAMRLKLPSGEEASMPFGQILGKTHAKHPRTSLAHSRRYRIRLSSELPLEQLLEAFRQSLSDAPWWLPGKVPRVEVQHWQGGVAHLDVQIHTLNTDDFLKVIHYSCKQFGDFETEEL